MSQLERPLKQGSGPKSCLGGKYISKINKAINLIVVSQIS